jgi:hypothetical protein
MYTRTCGARDVIESGAVVTAATHNGHFCIEHAHVNSPVLLLNDVIHSISDYYELNCLLRE